MGIKFEVRQRQERVGIRMDYRTRTGGHLIVIRQNWTRIEQAGNWTRKEQVEIGLE